MNECTISVFVVFFTCFFQKRKISPEGINWTLCSSEEEMGVIVVHFLLFKKYCSALEIALFSKTTTKGREGEHKWENMFII